MKRAIAIARVSTDEQATDDKTSLDTQLAEVRAWCEREGYAVADEVREEGVSVTSDLDRETMPRPFWAAYDRLTGGDVDTIVFLGQDRLSRSNEPLKVALLLSEAAKHRDGIRFVREARADQDPDIAVLVDYIRAISAKQDAQRSAEATLRGRRAKAAKGLKGSGSNLLGYRWLVDENRFETIPAEARVVRLIFNLYTHDRLGGMSRIAEELNVRNVPTPLQSRHPGPQLVHDPDDPAADESGHVKRPPRHEGQRWHGSRVSAILERECYLTGLWYRDGGHVPVEPLVDRETWEAAQQLRRQRPTVAKGGKQRILGNMRTGSRGLVQGRAWCGECGHRLEARSWAERGSRKGGAKAVTVHAYACPNHYRDPVCPLPTRYGPDLDETVWRALRQGLTDRRQFREGVLAYIGQLGARIAELSPELRRAEASLADLRKRRQRTIETFDRVGGDRERFETRVTELDAEIVEAEQPLREQEADTREHNELLARRARLEEALDRYGGEMTIEDETHEAGEPVPFDANAAIRVHYRAPTEEGVPSRGVERLRDSRLSTEETTKQRLVDTCELRIILWADGRVRLEGAVATDLDTGEFDVPSGDATFRPLSRTARRPAGCG